MSDNVKITDHTAEYFKEFDAGLEAALEAIGAHIEGEAKEILTNRSMPHKTQGKAGEPTSRPNIDTGLLRNSITYALDGEAPHEATYKADKGGTSGHYSGTAPKDGIMGHSRSVYIGTNVEYAPYIHEGTSKIPPNRFLKDAVEMNKDQIMQKLKNL